MKKTVIALLILVVSLIARPARAATVADFTISAELRELLASSETLSLEERDEVMHKMLVDYTAKHRDDPLGYYYLGTVCLNLAYFPEALSNFGNALGLAPDFADAHAQSAAALMFNAQIYGTGNATETMKIATDAIEKAISLACDRADFRSLAATIYSEKGDIPAALDAMKQSVRIDPGRAFDYFRLGNFYAAMKQYGLAIDSYNLSVILSSEKNPGATMPREDMADSVNASMLTAAYMDNNVINIVNAGKALEGKGKIEEALTEYAKALEMAPNSARVLRAYGSLYGSKLKNYKTAKRYYEQALEADPLDVESLEAICGLIIPMAIEEQKEKAKVEAAECKKPLPLMKKILELKYALIFKPENIQSLKDISSGLLRMGLNNSALPYIAALRFLMPDDKSVAAADTCAKENNCDLDNLFK